LAFFALIFLFGYAHVCPSGLFFKDKSGFIDAVIAGNYRGSLMRDDALFIMDDPQEAGAPGVSPAGVKPEVR
jgi:hypothetical protein